MKWQLDVHNVNTSKVQNFDLKNKFKYMIKFMTNISIIKEKNDLSPKVIMNKLFRTIVI
jgi:hypothetical protein